VYNRTSRGLSDDQIRKSIDEHKRKLLGWRVRIIIQQRSAIVNVNLSTFQYHVASKLAEKNK